VDISKSLEGFWRRGENRDDHVVIDILPFGTENS
jgi:hypothetical protein